MSIVKHSRAERYFFMQINSDFPYDEVPYSPYSRGKSVIRSLPNGIGRGDLVVTYFGGSSPEYKQHLGMVFEVVRLESDHEPGDCIRLKPFHRFDTPLGRSEIQRLAKRGILSRPFRRCGKEGFNIEEIKRSDYEILMGRRQGKNTQIAGDRGRPRNGTSKVFTRKRGEDQIPVESLTRDEMILEEIERIQTTLKKETVKSQRYERSRELAKRLKQLYHFRCQLCSPASLEIPPIRTGNGTFYVEVHHIQGFRETVEDAKLGQEEEECVVDNFKNVIVVCCYHHKLLHKYKDGFTFKVKQQRFVSNDRKISLPLRLNKHL